MAPRRDLDERKRSVAVKRQRLATEEGKIKNAERKARNRRLFAAGGLVEKAGLTALTQNALYGALLSIAERADDPNQIARWTGMGGTAFDREAKLRDEGLEPLIVVFAVKQPTAVTAALGAIGLRWNKALQHWSGLAKYEAAQALAAQHSGVLHRLSVPPMQSLSSPPSSGDDAASPNDHASDR